jgi:L-arabinose isomerase
MTQKYKFWFVVGSQHLYGPDVIEEVAAHSRTMIDGFNADKSIPFEVIFKGVVTTPDEIQSIFLEANNNPACTGIITWMHTFSPGKMWIGGLKILDKPYLHINTQFNKKIPFDTIDMNFMNTNQSAHGDREHGFITARMRMKRKVICGYWEDAVFRSRIAVWMRSAVGAVISRNLKVMRIGDNMRYVAVTEGDKVQAEMDLGWSVNTYGVGEFAGLVDKVNDKQIGEKIDEYRSKYILRTDNINSVRYQAKLEIALEKMITEGVFSAYTDTFEDLYGLKQLPGLATQNLMAKGIGFGPEGDWKIAALGAVINAMSSGLNKGSSFIEDYIYHFEEGNESVMGAHMLEISPAIAKSKPAIEVHQLNIGDRDDPARLVFEGKEGDAILVTVVDMGGRFRIIVHDVRAISPIKKMPNLPLASVMWKPAPDIITGNEAWIRCGGAHHSIISYDLTAEHLRDFAEIMGIEFIYVNKSTTIDDINNRLAMGDVIWDSQKK